MEFLNSQKQPHNSLWGYAGFEATSLEALIRRVNDHFGKVPAIAARIRSEYNAEKDKYEKKTKNPLKVYIQYSYWRARFVTQMSVVVLLYPNWSTVKAYDRHRDGEPILILFDVQRVKLADPRPFPWSCFPMSKKSLLVTVTDPEQYHVGLAAPIQTF